MALAALPEDHEYWHFEMALEGKSFEKFVEDPHAYAAQFKKPGRAEVSLRKLDGKQKEEMKKAMWLECNNWFDNKVCEPARRSEATGPLMRCR